MDNFFLGSQRLFPLVQPLEFPAPQVLPPVVQPDEPDDEEEPLPPTISNNCFSSSLAIVFLSNAKGLKFNFFMMNKKLKLCLLFEGFSTSTYFLMSFFT